MLKAPVSTIIKTDANGAPQAATAGTDYVAPGVATVGTIIAGSIKPAADSTTAVQIQKATDSSAVVNVDTSNGNVGIGTTSPVYPLSVESAATLIPSTGSGQINIANNSATSTDVSALLFSAVGSRRAQISAGRNSDVNTNAGYLAFTTRQGSDSAFYERMRIDNTGNVGIGTTSPTSKLEIKGAGLTSASSSLNVTNSNGTSMLYVRDDGKVGIGTTSPNAPLHIYRGPEASILIIDSGTAGTALAYSLAGVSKYTAEYVSASDFWAIGRSAVAYDLVLKTGNVGIGTTSPTSKLQVVGLPTYADNTAALAGGLTAGAFYRTSTGVLMVVY